MKLLTVFTWAAALSLGAAQSYEIPESLEQILTVSDCMLPVNFTIKSFRTWVPVDGNPQTPVLDFEYINNGTGIDTWCMWNRSSPTTDAFGPRFGCNDLRVEFIWSDGNQLTLIEAACPGSGGAGEEASGSVIVSLSCLQSDPSSMWGAGTACFTPDFFITGNFTSLEPRPPTRRGPSNKKDS